MQRWWAALGLLAVVTGPAAAADWGDWSVQPWEADWGDWTASLGGLAGADGFATGRGPGAGLAAELFPRLQTTLDNGWDVGLRGALLPLHDRLDGDLYGDRLVEKAFLFAQTPYGRFQAGEDDGAAYRLAVTGPSVDPAVAIDGATSSFFRDPATGRALIDQFRLQAAEFAGSNDAKFTYVSPELLGLQLAGSYTPAPAHGGLPFVSRGSGNDRQSNLLEGGAHYAATLGALGVDLSAGLAFAHDADATPGHGDLRDWSLGAQGSYRIDAVTLRFGGAFRRSNAYAFDIADVRDAGATDSWNLAATATRGPFVLGWEFAAGRADAATPRPDIDEHGREIALGYVLNANVQLTTGWQGLGIRRGAPFDDASDVNAGFVRLQFRV